MKNETYTTSKCSICDKSISTYVGNDKDESIAFLGSGDIKMNSGKITVGADKSSNPLFDLSTTSALYIRPRTDGEARVTESSDIQQYKVVRASEYPTEKELALESRIGDLVTRIDLLEQEISLYRHLV
ncbi:hypothetical protein LCM23_06140 [Cytobacillus kochii]|uniref:hypothetical protein n=1 Tax=Cytobacillus kochii TaxID=859143 RepID=UPI001CD1F2E9|nr:hypothetical protein [Cytobacillus kochii]MCA1025664.1 hypothetical protein [Cytobacillus kochii]